MGRSRSRRNMRRRRGQEVCWALGWGWPPAWWWSCSRSPRSAGACSRLPLGRRGAGCGGRSRSGRDEPQGSEGAGEHLDAGQAGVVVVAVSDMGAKIERAMKQGRKVEARQLKADTAGIEADAN